MTITHDTRWRVARWGGAAALLCVPALAMLFSSEVRWDVLDFAIMAALLAAANLAYEALAKGSGNLAYRAAAALTAGGVLLLAWVNLAVGIVGDEGNAANLLFALPAATIIGGAIVVRHTPAGMAPVLLLAAASTAIIVAAAALLRLDAGAPGAPYGTLGAGGVFVAIFLVAAALFARAARG